MVITLNKYYYGYPICYEGYEITNKSVIVNVINIRKEHLTEVKIIYGSEEYILKVDSSDYKICLEITDIDTQIIKNPKIEYVISNKKKYVWDEYTSSQQLAKPKSVGFLGKERLLYIRNIRKELNLNKDLIRVVPFNGPDYWICTCGHINFGDTKDCIKCSSNKVKLFSVKTIYEKEGLETASYFKANTLYAIWTSLLYIAYFVIQMIAGDFLFKNELKNTVFGVWHRVLAPLSIILVTVVYLYSMIKYYEVIKKICVLIRHILILYLNLMLCFFSIATAYTTIFIIGVDIIAVSYMIYLHLAINKRSLLEFVFYGLTVLLFVVGGVKLINYSRYDLKVIEGGIELVVYTDTTTYNVPEHFDNLDLISIKFDKDYNYNIKELNISKNLNNISIYSNAVLSKLEKINLHKNNNSFVVDNEVLYNAITDKIQLVPITVKKLEIDYEVLDKNALHYTLGLEEIVIKNTVKEIKNNALYGCPKLEKIVFEDGSQLEIIGDYAFGECISLKTIDLPISVQSVGIGILYQCNSLKEYKAPFLGFKREDDVDNYAATDILMKVFGVGDYKCSYYIPASLEKVEIYDIEIIHNVTFYEAKNIKSIILPKQLFNIGIRSFYGCESLLEFEIPEGVETIKTSCFENCKSMEKIVISSSVKTIETNAFKGCDSLKEVIYLGDVNQLVIAEGNDIIKDILLK